MPARTAGAAAQRRSRGGFRFAHAYAFRRAPGRDAPLQVGGQQDSDLDRKQAAARKSERVSFGIPDLLDEALAAIPFDRNSNDFHFDTEIIIQLLIAGLPIKELPIPTYYGDEICYVNGMKYAFNVVVAALRARLQERGLFYDRKFDCAPGDTLPYVPKFIYTSPHSLAFERIRPGSRCST